MADTFNYKHGAAIAIPFSKSNLTTGESNTDLVLAGATTLYVAPVAGSVVAISARASAALTAGTITLSGHSTPCHPFCGRGDIGHICHHHHHARRDQHVRC